MLRLHFHRSARNIEIRSLLDTLFVCSIATILLIRLQLWATNYPRLGGGKLHIAHLLWGGLGMLAAIVILLSFIGRGRRRLAAILGGVGFGFFIDEIGKFVTSNNDYFFKPAAGIIYIVFIGLFLIIRELGWRRQFSPQECLANAMALLSESSFRKLKHEEEGMSRALLARCDSHDPIVPTLYAMLERIEAEPDKSPGRIGRLRIRIRAWYLRVAVGRRFAVALVVLFGLSAVITLVSVGFNADDIFNGSQKPKVITVAGLASSVVVCGLILVGINSVWTSRLEAYRWFDRALLVQVFFAEVFAFLEYQFAAAFELLFTLFLLFTLRIMIHAEVGAHVEEGLPSLPTGVIPGDAVAAA
jgi:hypothetical protein